MTTNTFALNKELRPLLEATAAQKGVPLLKAPKGDLAPAVGWIKALEVRDGGVWLNGMTKDRV